MKSLILEIQSLRVKKGRSKQAHSVIKYEDRLKDSDVVSPTGK